MGTTSKRIKGALKEAEGKLTGDAVRETEGKIENAVGRAGAAIKAGVRKVKMKAAKAVVTTKVGRKAAAAKLMK